MGQTFESSEDKYLKVKSTILNAEKITSLTVEYFGYLASHDGLSSYFISSDEV
jgi:hypothetical protein